MSDVSDSELLSAYLDGELTAEEQARAEKMLALSAEARQLLEELRAVGGALQGLPQQNLDEDLSARVLQIAERRVLSPEASDETADSADKPSAGRAASEGFPWREISWRGMFSPRALIWSAIIVLVAIVIHYTAPPENGNRQQARLDENKLAAGAKVAADEKRSNAAPQPAFRAPAGQPERKVADMPASGGEGSKSAAKADENLDRDNEKVDGSELASGRAGGRLDLATTAVQAASSRDQSRGEPVREKPAASQLAAKDAGGGFGGGGPGGEGGPQRGRRMNAKKAVPPAEHLADEEAARAAEKAPAASPVASAAPQLARGGAGAAEMDAGAKRQEQPTTTVKVNLTAAALRNGAFNAVLVRNGLVPRPVLLDGRQQAMTQFQNYGVVNGKYAADNMQMRAANSGSAPASGALQQIAPQSLPAANEPQGGAQNASRSTAPQASDGQLLADSAPRGATAAPANNFNGPSSNASGLAVQQNQANSIQQSAAGTAVTLNLNGALGNGAVPLCCECDATPAQLARVLKQLGQQRDGFSQPEVFSSMPLALPQAARRDVADRKAGEAQYEFETAKAAGVPAAQGKSAERGRAESDTDKLESLPRQGVAGRGFGGARPLGSGGAPQSRAWTQNRAAAEKTRVLFMLNVVDRVAPPPTAAAPAPAAPRAPTQGK